MLLFCLLFEKFTLFYAYMYVQTVYQVCDYSALGMIIPETTCCSLSTALTLTNEIVQGQVSYSPISTVWIQILADFTTKQNQVMCSLILKLAVIIYFFFEKNVKGLFLYDLNDIIDILYRVNSLTIREYDRGYLV